MNGRNAGGRRLASLGAAAVLALGVAACGPRADDIDQVQPGYVRKSIFKQDSEWYYRRTVAKSETTNALVIEGSGDLPIDRIRWRIEETKLVAYKPYENIPGSETSELEGSLGFQGTVVASFPIVSHFDIRRGYDSATGNETNVIGENASDRPWHERDYMRVDWAADELAGTFADNLYEFPVDWVSTAKFWSNLETDPTNEFAARFSDDYIEFSHTALLGMDLYTCLAFTGFSSAAGGCGYGEAQIRHSFVRVKEKSDFVPVAYPDSIVRKGTDGKAITDAETGEVLREPIFSRFGFFRREIPTYDPGYGYTESGKLYRAMIFNLWKRHTNENGEPIPCTLTGCEREPKPVIYYLNAEYPARWRKVAQEVAAEYDRVLKGLVQDLVGPARTPEHMFEIRDNDCNIPNIKSFVTNNRGLEFAVARAVCSQGEACDNPLEKVAFGNLTKVCSSLEAATRDPVTGTPRFDWQRIGDARFNMLVYLLNPQDSGWGGYGPMHSDALSGETVSASAYIRGNYYETTAATIVDYIELINDEKKVEDIIYGQDIRKHIQDVVGRSQRLSSMQASPAFAEMMERRMQRLGSSKEQMLREVSPDRQLNRIKLAEGTKVEEAMITDLDLMMASGGKWKPGQPVPEEIRKLASPLGRATVANPGSVLRRQARAALGASGFCDLKYDLDPHWAGLALALKDLPREMRYEIVASKLLKHVMLHELGHNFGMSHNFEGTFDALNYGDTFWSYAWASSDDKLYYRFDEHRNSSVMEYIGSKGAFSDYLGKYDEAAIRFAYANQVAVFSSPKVDAGLQGGERLRAWRYMNDYMKLPEHLCAPGACATPEDRREVLTARAWKDFDPQNPPTNEVPFLFCDNRFDGLTPFCSTFDYGSNLREIFANYYTRWSNYFFFNNFVRDRLVPLAWSPNTAIAPLIDALGFVSVVGQYAYFYQANDPSFARSELGQDMLTTVANGLNMAAEVLSTPQPIRMCPWPGSNPKVYIPWYYNSDVCDQYADLKSPYAIQQQAIQLPLGDARPSSLGFTEDYEDYDWAFVGSYFDKSNVLWLLGLNRPTFLRYNFDIDRRTYDISLFRLFEPELRSFYDRVINLDGYLIEQQTARDLGSYWCRDAGAPGLAYRGRFEPRRMIDPAAVNPSSPGPPENCDNPSLIYPELLRNMPFSGMFWAHALYSSDFDSQLDMGKSLKVYVFGADDDYPSWDALPADQICSVVDSLTGLEYRAIRQPSGIPDLGCRLISKTQQAQRDWLGSNNSPFQKDRWRAWFERLEYARDLTRTFNR